MKNTVARYLEDIRRRGDRAVAVLLRRFDGLALGPRAWRVTADAPRRALRGLPRDRRRALEGAAGNIRFFHEAEKRHGARSWRVTAGGRTLGQDVRPVASAGLYVPGGRFAYPSTVLMTAIPAAVAGVPRIVVATPPRHLTPEVLAACALAGVHEIYRIGGVAAIGALAFGTATVPAVDLIAGPGGAWVTEAKRQVFGAVGIDMLAGPSEIAVVADGSVPAAYVAADLMAQAEHDPLARAVLISTDGRALAAIRAAVAPGFRAQCDFVKVPTLAAAARAASRRAPEHLSLAVRNPAALLEKIPNAGAAFLGPWSPVAVGDYWAGPSHVLPTGRSARFASGLSVQTFLKRTSVIAFSRPALRRAATDAALFAEAEGLAHHARSLEVRFSS
ncbi:MAG: histidinol dehydrogenase [Elusimicrobia bacterium]|nr:histidinol dehydrogenase [Elusimicrobiota bacterium]MBK7207040.1 histidinol dehydrogenase [Elusimicrobiota bacterium]MBK7545860.1 histidinol dehydrogenase [Elusimicrobiota bacterium]MBK7575124.1 histidinol dehydrogenase [Elusimicrobiota bacterium]MBK7687612.1 histidinol dehydrogenase [Elusimicrobiota bacterium]